MKNSIEEDIECRQDFLEFDVDGDWAELKKILNKSRKTNEYIMYKGEKWIKEKYCIPIQKLKEILEKTEITNYNKLVDMFLEIKKILESEE